MNNQTLNEVLKIVENFTSSLKEPVVGRIKTRFNDPFLILVSTILSLRTKDTTTEKVFERLYSEVKNVNDLKNIEEKKLEEIIKPVGFYKNKAKILKEIAETLLQKYDGKVPKNLKELLKIKGIGRKTANLVIIEGFNKYGICVDTHVHRILNRWSYVKTKSPDETEQVLRKKLPKRWWKKINGILVTFGQNVCLPRYPRCNSCPVLNLCPYTEKNR